MNPNIYKNQRTRGLKRKREIINEFGGKCCKCGYDKNMAALEFHHFGDKDFSIDLRKFSNTSLIKLRKELEKCILLCSNCHREIHNPDLTLNNVDELMLQNEIDHKSFQSKQGRKCLNCDARFPISTGRLFCSNACRHADKPKIDDVMVLYDRLKSWDKVAAELNTTRKIIQLIRKRS